MLGVKQVGIKYYFLNLWYDSTFDWTQVSQTIGEHSNHYTNESNKYLKLNGERVFGNQWNQLVSVQQLSM